VIVAPGPEHARLARATIGAGKDVYSEWPLSTTTAESEELLALAQEKGVRHIVGLQRRFAPSACYTRDLIAQGYVGKIRGVNMSVGVDAFAGRMPGAVRWALDDANFTHLLSIYAGHFGDMLFHSVGFPTRVAGVIENQMPFVDIIETGEKVPYTSPNEVMAIGTLEHGGLFSIQFEGGQERRTGLHILITGTEGVLRITNPRGFQNTDDNRIEGMTGDSETYVTLDIPAEYKAFEMPGFDQSTQDVAYLYGAYANDLANGTSTASNFKDAVAMHRFIDQIASSSERFFQQ
jgi:predicted dehydrogenase